MRNKNITRLILSCVIGLSAGYSTASAQSSPALTVKNREAFKRFCNAHELKEAPFLQFGWSSYFLFSGSLDAVDEFLTNVSLSNSPVAPKVQRLFGRQSLYRRTINNLELKESGLSGLPAPAESSCPSGMMHDVACIIGSCEFFSGVSCVRQDESAFYLRKKTILERFAKLLDQTLTEAAKDPAFQAQADLFKQKLLGFVGEHLPTRTSWGIAFTCKPAE